MCPHECIFRQSQGRNRPFLLQGGAFFLITIIHFLYSLPLEWKNIQEGYQEILQFQEGHPQARVLSYEIFFEHGEWQEGRT